MKTLLLGWLLLLSVTALAQDDFYKKEPSPPVRRQQYVITLRDGTKLVGQLIRQDSLEAVIRTRDLGQVVVRADQIVSTVVEEQAGGRRGGRGLGINGYPNLFPQYMNLTPTAYQAERGRLYYRNSMLFFNQFDYGITENWSIGTGLHVGPITALLSFNTKISFPVGERVRLGVQGQYAAGAVYFFDFEQVQFSYVQGLASIGTPQRNVTFGLGTVFAGGEFSSAKLLTIGIVRKVKPGLTFISENHLIFEGNDGLALLSGGLRFDRRRHSFDVALKLPVFRGIGAGLTPYASYQLRIGK